MLKVLFVIVSCALLARSEPILGGRKISVTEFNYRFIVLLHIFIQENHDGVIKNLLSQCSGSLIKQNMVITAAHCVSCSIAPPQMKIYGGLPTIPKKSTISRKWIDYAVRWTMEKFIIHPDYKSLGYDVALIYLTNKEREQPGEVVVGQLLEVGPIPYEPVIVSGWGLKENNNRVKSLREATLDHVLYSSSHHCARFPQFKMCLQDLKNISTTCHGDSGGPVIRNNIIVGVINGGLIKPVTGFFQSNEVCDPAKPTSAVPIPSIIKWIKDPVIRNKYEIVYRAEKKDTNNGLMH